MELKEKIINQISHNKLDTLDKDFLISQLSVLNNMPYDDVRKIVDTLNLKNASEKQQTKSNQHNRDDSFELKTNNFKIRKNKPNKFNRDNDKSKKVRANYLPNYKQYDNDNVNTYQRQDFDPNAQAIRSFKLKDKKNTKVFNVTGKIQSTSKGYAFLLPTSMEIEDVFIPARELAGALNNDMVTCRVTQSSGKRPEGKVIQIIERGTDSIVGKIIYSKTYATVKPDDVKFGKDIIVPLNKTNDAPNNYKVVCKIEHYFAGKRAPEGRVTEVLGEPNKIETEITAIIRSYKLYNSFPSKVAEYAQQLPQEIDANNFPNRTDLRDKLIFTIDGADTRDIDDAISLEINQKGNRVLGVHIADVGEYVKRGNVLDNEAFKRGTSVYFPNLVIPMLPQELSNGICSLNEKVDRLALSVFVEYDKDAKVVDYKICESIIHSKKRYTYSEVMAVIDNDSTALENNKEFVSTIHNMNELAKQLAGNRVKRGEVLFNIPEVKVSLNDLGDILEVETREHNDSHKLIESFMIAANEAIAEHFQRAKIPFVYRVHETPTQEKMNNFVAFAKNLGVPVTLNTESVQPYEIQKVLTDVEESDFKFVLSRVCLRSMRKAKYMPECLGHFGLASTYYCHFTSPIRRYPDLTIHRIIKDSINGRLTNIEQLKEFVEQSSINSSQTEVNAEKVERDVDDLYKVFYMTHHVGEEFEGIISSVTSFGVFVELDNTVEGLVKLENLPRDYYSFNVEKQAMVGSHHTYQIGDKVNVQCARADLLSREIDFVLIEEKN